MSDDFGLISDEIAEAEHIICRAPAGLYTLAKLHGAAWNSKLSPTTVGVRFKASVVARQTSGISLHRYKTGANALQNLVHDRGR